ncbi:protein GOLM2-like isoform X1 [Nerophis lumbriciformis]|uniref:protein GOLM2-like isoform X1 n=1 Tax=Nerophis lumbriciformis TaxID=546530 RepID=UPI002AE06B3E|nr:protein GOLM2-like [Nerophis lumbriciformis]
MIGFGANRRGGRLPSFVLVFLMAIVAILAFNYWTVSSKHGRSLDELLEVQSRVKRTDAARSRLEKRNSELMVQVDAHRKQLEQKDGEYVALKGRLQARDAVFKKCTDEKTKVQDDVTAQMTEIQRLKEQLTDLKQEFMKQEEQLKEVKRNRTTLERKLEYESLQCGRQIAQLKTEYDESKKTLEEEVVKLRWNAIDSQKGIVAGRHTDGVLGGQLAEERRTVATHSRDSLDLKDIMGKPGSDAGMPGIEDSEVGKLDEVQFELKKPAITQQRDEAPDVLVGAGAGPGMGAADGPGGQGLSLDQPQLQHDRVEVQAAVIAPPGVIKMADKTIVFEEDNKADIKADELGEQQRQIRAPDVKGEVERLKSIPLPGNPAQLPNPIQPHRAKDQVPAGARHHQSRFFDEIESPVDPQHGSKLADYNGDDGNVGEYEADKQAELAYNEEEDGDGGEEDVQDDEDRDMQGDRAVDYGKRHQAIDVL